MSNVREYRDGPYCMLELREDTTGTTAAICPERGGIATGYAPWGRELFYLDRDTLLDPAANIRGGNPVLFPISGQLKEGAYELDGVRYSMKNHGLARTSPWTVAETGVTPAGEPFARLRLVSTDAMLESFPYAFELNFTYLLRGSALIIQQEYKNSSDRPMPMYPGFHPYFATSHKKLSYRTDATRYLDYNDGVIKDLHAELDMEGLQEAVVLLDAQKPEISFQLPAEARTVTLRYSGQFRYVVIWTAAGKDFVCVEPWMGLNGELNRGDNLIWVEPGQALAAHLEIDAGGQGADTEENFG